MVAEQSDFLHFILNGQIKEVEITVRKMDLYTADDKDAFLYGP